MFDRMFESFKVIVGKTRVAYVKLVALAMITSACSESRIDFSTEVKPILNKHCISCHGGVKRNGGFSLLFRTEALDTTESGKPVIIPGDAKHSEMIRRLTATDPEVRMPYKEEPLSKEQIEILTQWIDEGAQWGDHWAYVAPTEVEVPMSKTLLSGFFSEQEWPKNEIDYFILDKLKKENLSPAAVTEKSTLLRRAYLDIIGLPPTPEQAGKFLEDESPQAYENLVDELLASPHYGEKWASWWLDLARYSDTKGYERDVGRNIWRYRDWVIKAFNNDMPFDQFTIEQLAGDMLPNPTDDQLIATAFHRNTMNNDEGGTEDEEFRVAALIDRNSTTWEVWQSTTMACVQCHTHPYDPFVHDEYYKSMAFFNNTRDEDTHGEHPNLRSYSEGNQKEMESIRKWVLDKEGREKALEVTRFLKTLEPKYHPHDFDQFTNSELIDTKWLGVRPGGSARLKQINLTAKNYLLINYSADIEGTTMEIRADQLNGQRVASVRLQKTTSGRKVLRIPLKAMSGKHDLYFTLRNAIAKSDQTLCNIEWFAFRDELPGKGTSGFPEIDRSFITLLQLPVDNTPVMIENNEEQHRDTYIFERGNWLVKGNTVSPDVPHSLNPFLKDAPRNRLGFAHWLMDQENPLTARTLVNRIWEQLFGYGIVETLEDFGTQGALPSHPELLDWLSLKMMNDYQWSMKKLIKKIVMSATYQQDSRVTPELLEKDASNRWLARGPRVRLSAEQVRDQTLAVSGLLSKKMYGKSVMPFQPEGIWSSVWSGEYWKNSEGEDQFRRSVYTYAKRTSPYPSMMIFDGASREVCVSRRIRTNTPLQALVTLNDSSYVVAARSFAKKMTEKAKTPKEQIRSGYQLLLIRDIPESKLNVLASLYDDALKNYLKDQKSASALMADKEATPQLAALTIVAQALLNLDEVITKE
jgi:hypothetical protein